MQIQKNQMAWPRKRFTACIGLFGACLGIAAILISFMSPESGFLESAPKNQQLSNMSDYVWQTSQDTTMLRGIILSVCGLIGGAFITVPVAYWWFGEKPTFTAYSKKTLDPRGIPAWLMMGLMYGIIFPLIVGGYFLPFGRESILFLTGLTSVPELVISQTDLFTGKWIRFMFVVGARLVFAGMFAGFAFGPGGWIIDKFISSDNQKSSRFTSWIVTCVMSFGVILFALIWISD
ncbi:hypothetical protein OAJ59_00595 [bacterium]|nr:hypothetical protein [bacterium]